MSPRSSTNRNPDNYQFAKLSIRIGKLTKSYSHIASEESPFHSLTRILANKPRKLV
jgi:hypothetical protein